MRKTKTAFFLNLFCFLFIFGLHNFYSQSGLNDCAGAIELCGNGSISSNAIGTGIQELNNNNACSSREHNSLWIKIEITKAGTLGFNLIPTSSAIEVDYDFFVFGPNLSCGNLGMSIRCSTTNPKAAGLSSNHTGMNDQETDLSEGPGVHGNSYVRSLNVLPGEFYYIVIDRPIGKSPFKLEWTGTSTVGGSPFPEGVEAIQPEDLLKCSFNGVAEFDVFKTREVINNLPQTQIRYYESLGDAIDKIDEIRGNYTSSQPRKTIYARVESPKSECFEIVEFDLIITKGPPVVSSLEYELCDTNQDGSEEFLLSSLKSSIVEDTDPEAVLVTYFKNFQEARDNINSLESPYTSAGEMIYARTQKMGNSGCFSISEINLKLRPVSVLQKFPEGSINFSISSNRLDFDFPSDENYVFSLDSPSGPFQNESVFDNVQGGLHTLHILNKELCELFSIDLVIPGFRGFFSPNGDGYHDQWNIETFGLTDSTTPIRIFNRYGKLLTEIFPGSQGWDGNFNGKKMPSDDYWFILRLPYAEITGHFSLIR